MDCMKLARSASAFSTDSVVRSAVEVMSPGRLSPYLREKGKENREKREKRKESKREKEKGAGYHGRFKEYSKEIKGRERWG
jgi:hypothetical protein